MDFFPRFSSLCWVRNESYCLESHNSNFWKKVWRLFLETATNLHIRDAKEKVNTQCKERFDRAKIIFVCLQIILHHHCMGLGWWTQRRLWILNFFKFLKWKLKDLWLYNRLPSPRIMDLRLVTLNIFILKKK